MRVIWQDLRFAVRQLLRSPGYLATTLLSLACGIAATTAVFSVVWAVVVNPYPYAAPGRMVHFALGSVTGNGYDGVPMTATQWMALRQSPVLEDSVLTNFHFMTVTGAEMPENLNAQDFSGNGFNFFGVAPLLGRNLLPADAPEGQDPQPVVELGYKFWQRHYLGDRGVVGKTLELGHKPYTIVGVTPRRFTWGDADIYLPLKVVAGTAAYTVEARLKPGVTHRMAEEQLQPLVTEFERQTPAFYPTRPGPLRVIGLNEQFLKAIGPSLALLFGAVLLLLGVGCGNVSILLLARGTAREAEFAVRAAIGASRGRLVGQLLTEALLLSVTGAALGVLLAFRLVKLIVALLPEFSFPHEAAIEMNLPVLVFSVAVAVATGLLFGLWPALRLSRPDVREAMGATRTVSGSRRGRLVHDVLIGAQMTLTLLLLSTAGAAIASFEKLTHARLGYDPRNVISVPVPTSDKTYATLAARQAHLEALRERIAEVPGVQAVAVANAADPPNSGVPTTVELLGEPATSERQAKLNFVSPDFFALLKMPMLEGGTWSEAENHGAAKVVVVNHAFVAKYFPGGDAVGHSLAVGVFKNAPPFVSVAPGAGGWLRIVGVCGDKLNDGLREAAKPEIFVPYTLGIWSYNQMLVKSEVAPSVLVRRIGLQVAAVDRDQQIGGRVPTLEQLIEETEEYAEGQLVSWLFGAFAGLALVLSAVGLYSVVSYTVVQRWNEFGIRMALGSPRVRLMRLVLRSTAVSVGGGLVAGLVLTLLLQRVLAHLDAAAARSVAPMAGAMGLLFAVAMLAGGIPAYRAARISPARALREG